VTSVYLNASVSPAPGRNIVNQISNLEHRKKLQIQKAHMVNAMESFLSAVVNDAYSEVVEAEFLVRLNLFEMTQPGVSSSAEHYSVYVYQWKTNKNKISSEILDFDGGANLKKIFWISARNSSIDEEKIASLKRAGLWKFKVAEIENFLHVEGSQKLTIKIKKIQSTFGFHSTSDFKKVPNIIKDNDISELNLLQCMSNITTYLTGR